MLTKVILEGVLGKHFGREWELEVTSVGEALRMIEVNQPGLMQFIHDKLGDYSHYKVIAESVNGVIEELGEEDVGMLRQMKELRIIPLISGSGAVGRIIAGVVLIVVGAVLIATGVGAALGAWVETAAASMIAGGVATAIGGVIQLLTPQPKMQTTDQGQQKDKTNRYFDGPQNTVNQGIPISLIYGEAVMVGSQPINASMVVV